MKLTLLDGSILELENGLTAKDAAKAISAGLARVAVGAKFNGKLIDLNTALDGDGEFCVLTFKDEEGKAIYRHTCAHVLADAVKKVYPNCKLAIGPSIKTGFYYDFEFRTPITQANLATIESEMQKIIKADYPVERFELSRKDALQLMKDNKETYKTELIRDLPSDETISFYRQGGFVDLCRGPHLPSTGMIKAFKLTSIAGAYWRGDENNKMLTRIYGVAFDKKADLDEYIEQLEEAKRRDHNKLGRDLGLFMTEENIGQGLPILMPKGAKIIQILSRFVEDEEERRGYMYTRTPLMAKSNLYKISGHWDHYRDKMFVIGDESNDEEVYALRPMTCPFQFMIYKNGLKSYRDLPVRYNETATEFRKEASGEMHGLIRVRQFTLADGHIMCMPEQLESEFAAALDLIKYMLDCLGLTDVVSFRFSKWDENDKEKYVGTKEQWDTTQGILKRILDDLGIVYAEADGEAAFYGPKLDIQSTNVYGKEDTLFTIQIDFALAERFDMWYIDENGEKKHPYIIHRSSIGCYERTLAMLIERYAGAFPLWIAPVQVKIMSLTDRTAEAANELTKKLTALGIRCEVDNRSEKIGYKIREAQLEKIPYMAILGDKEVEGNVIAVRHRSQGDLGTMSFGDLTARLLSEIAEKVKN